MVLGLLIITAIPATVGVCEALSAQKKANASEKEKAKFNLVAMVTLDDGRPAECWCVLAEGKIWIDHPEAPVQGHRFAGHYFTYPSEAQDLGLVSTIADDPPVLNWIFVDGDSHMLRHGGRQATLAGGPHTVGPWGWSSDERRLTLEGRDDGFVAVEQENKGWALAYDPEGHICLGHEFIDGSTAEELPWLAPRHQSPRRGAAPTVQDTGGDDAKLAPEGGKLQDDRDGKTRGGRRGGKLRWMPVRLHRKMVFGMESRYVKKEGVGAGGDGNE